MSAGYSDLLIEPTAQKDPWPTFGLGGSTETEKIWGSVLAYVESGGFDSRKFYHFV